VITMTMRAMLTAPLSEDAHGNDALRSAAAFLAGFRSPDTRESYQRDLACWLDFCATTQLHP
jgi:hypothetical protein